jgi:hypothetical protein
LEKALLFYNINDKIGGVGDERLPIFNFNKKGKFAKSKRYKKWLQKQKS